MRDSKLEKHRFKMLQAKALAYDIDPAGDYMKPGNRPPEQAFQVLWCASHMLLHLADNAFPVLDKRIRKKGGKWLRESYLYRGDLGTLTLAHAVPALLSKLDGRLSGDEPPELSAEHHRRMYDTVKSFYPLGKKRGPKSLIDEWLAEFQVMEDHKPREAVAEGDAPANEYSQALMRGENPNEDPELVRMQRDYARDYFISRAVVAAIRSSLAANDVKLLEDKLVVFTALSDPEASEVRERELRAWIEGSKPYLEYAKLDAQ